VPRLKWETWLQDVRGTVGPLVTRRLASATYTQTLPGAPAGEYVVIQYHARYERRALAIETVTPVREKDGRWRVSGYFIR
jgi:hypothetical protein